jgi:ubiquinone/menaquinone biosynthesis C-methylase UbiE|uniref:Polyketide synthase-like methyltransferase domain-containing protein n=1 Tax=Eutreptiella gymnastica TaxID=73025 RepID=A0A7S4GI67_9EUGL|eukprot:CAMPEP_0174286474 /NCGR_PEP_ID=MMETSP0809-20121228/12030_1 /TAXON_ID=73025 ORGANISM="Eutreptiella gymnastica-like, Strain CCMP1594" /NCGR_SAMPLE_ID=MMETSP0809 /ASSEMBLY_ACC=CAM_ASM_000658 /LENGTH=281 /DNA_ID=CAMNT_0015382565 /DNA_START=23 /DNA_END=868 /DNA_ORIENTATION=-
MAVSSYEKDVTLMEGEKPKVNLYDGHYSDHMKAAQTKVRIDTYGEDGDLGQSSWMTVKELNSMMEMLEVNSTSRVLEVGCGAGGTSVYVAKRYACKITGVDLNPHGVETANQLAAKDGVSDVADFVVLDASKPLPFEPDAFDAVFCNDTMCHIPSRKSVLEDWKRVLKPDGKMVFTDAMVVSGMVSSDEFATRSSIGKYYYPPLGENEKIIKSAGFELLDAIDTTPEAAQVAKRWHDSRDRYKAELQEPEDNFNGLQKFLHMVYTLLFEHRLSRFIYLAKK